MIIRNDFMKNNDGAPVIPGVRTPFEYVQEQTKIRNANMNKEDKKSFNGALELHKLEQENSLRRFSNNANENQPFGKN